MKKFLNFLVAAGAIVGLVLFHPFVELGGYIMGKFGKKPKNETKEVKSDE